MISSVEKQLLPAFDKAWTAIAGSKKLFKTLARDFVLPDGPIAKEVDFISVAARMLSLLLSCNRVSSLVIKTGDASIEYPFFGCIVAAFFRKGTYVFF